MRKNLSVTAAVAFLALIAVLVPVALAGSNPPTIKQYQNERGNKITSIKFNTEFFVAGDKLNTLILLQCLAGKVEGKVQWWEMEFEAVSSKLIEAVPDPHCAGTTAPLRGWYSLTSNIVGPDLTVTANPGVGIYVPARGKRTCMWYSCPA